MQFLIVTGLSGAGKTSVLHHLEDGGWQCMDNLPPMLLSQVFQLFERVEANTRVVLGVDCRSGALFDPEAVLEAVRVGRESHDISILFLDCDRETLIDRFKETRRDHPLMRSGITLEEALRKEQEILQPMREQADYILNSAGLRTRELCKNMDVLLSGGSQSRMRVEIMSFGYKRGISRESDLVFDVRFLPNPFYIKDIRAYTGLEAPVRDFVLGKPETQSFLTHLYTMLDDLIPQYQNEGKRRLMISIGCTGGAHRSVAISEALYEHLRASGIPVSIQHRDIGAEESSWAFRRDHTQDP